MKGYKIPQGFVEGYRNTIDRYPKDSDYAKGMNAVIEELECLPLEELDLPKHGRLISEDDVIEKLRKGYHDKNLQSGKDDPCVIDAMVDWAIRQVKEVPSSDGWHTGIPTEEGWYLIQFTDGYDTWFSTEYLTHKSIETFANHDKFDNCFWQKIEPYEAN